MPNQFTSVWSKHTHEKLNKLFNLKDEQYTFDEIAQILRDIYKEPFTEQNCKAKYYRELPNKDDLMNDTYQEPFKESIEHKENGVIEHDKLIQLTEEDAKNPKRVMELCGYDPNEWEVINCQVGFWTYRDKETPDGKVSRTCKLKVKPKENKFDFDRLIEAIEKREPKEPIEYKGAPPQEPTYLELPLFDLHFGIADLDYYHDTLQEILDILQKPYKEVLLFVGQDCLHNDNFRGQTANGTLIDHVDMVKAIDDVELFYETIIDEALKNSEKVTVAYNKGNHDESMAYMLARSLRNLYRKQSNITFDIEFKERKAFMLGLNFIGTTHGDKNRNNLQANFTVEFPLMWSQAKTREVHIGHLHRKRATKKGHEFINDADGLIVRELGTGNKTDGYHEDNGFNLAHKEFEIFEYTETRKKRIHYV